MPSKLYLAGDSDAIWLMLPPDEALSLIEQARANDTYYLRLDMVPITQHDTPRPAYFNPAQVAALLPLDPREIQAEYDDPPDWLT